MRDIFLFIPLGIPSLVFQSTVFYLIPGDFHIDLILILVVYLGFTRDVVRGGVLAFCLGYMMDVCSGGIRGTFCFSRYAMFLVTAVVTRKFFTAHPLFIGVFTILLSVLDGLLVVGILQMNGTWRIESLDMGSVALHAVVTGVAAPMVFALLRRADTAVARLVRRSNVESRGEH